MEKTSDAGLLREMLGFAAERLMELGVGSKSGARTAADAAFSTDPALPLIEAELSRPELREEFPRIARSRIASVIKSVGYFTSKQLVPTFSNPQFQKILAHINYRASSVIDMVADHDPNFILRNRVINLAHSEYINDEVLDRMPLADVLKLRTKAWGKQAEARDRLLQSAAAMAVESRSAKDFDSEIQKHIVEYKKSWDDILLERRSLAFSEGLSR